VVGRFFQVAGLVTVIVATLAVAPPGFAYEFGPTVRQLAPEETVFDWSSQRCDDYNIPDAPVRAFTDASGQAHLTVSWSENRQMLGPDLNQVAMDCRVTMSSDANADPASYDDREWIHSTWTPDGNKVFALVHDEYHGWEHPGQCSSEGFSPSRLTTVPSPSPLTIYCWYNAITVASSSDGGLTYTHATPPAQLVASVPYVYVPDAPPYGYFSPSDVVRKSDGYFYVLFQAEAYGAQQAGTCVMRTKNPLNPSSFRAWDGSGYNVQFIDPYTNPGPPENHVCQVTSVGQISTMHESVTYSSFFKKYLLVGAAGLYDPGSGQVVYGVYYSTSTDLVNWSARQLLMKAELPWSYTCGDDNPILYPVLLNPGSTSRNFDTTSPKTYLYFTRFNYSNCIQTLDRDLIRIPIQFLPTVTGG
jgi:hypothetical protein